MQAQPFHLVRQDLGALPILDRVIERIGLLPHLTEALGQARYAQAILLLLKNIFIERNALYAIQEWAAEYDPALVYGEDTAMTCWPVPSIASSRPIAPAC